jgi:hypothetical protein
LESRAAAAQARIGTILDGAAWRQDEQPDGPVGLMLAMATLSSPGFNTCYIRSDKTVSPLNAKGFWFGILMI